MLSTVTKPKTNSNLIRNWLHARQELIVNLNQLCNLRPFAKACQSTLSGALQEFCQLVVDYLSLGHFEVYEQITQKSEKVNFQRADQLLRALRDTTFKTLDFNDKYQTKLDINALEQDLSMLALHMAQRFEWEDELNNL